MEQALGTTANGFCIITVAVMGFAAYMTGQALARTWRSLLQLSIYCALLGLADRFLVFALFEGTLSSLAGYLADTLLLSAVALYAFQRTRARKMVTQYHWLYERAGLFAWRKK
ncbi:MAG TPA: hypothetical protein QF509_01535 [Rhodospirillales bacterium]|jgi:hypothetical protein|nr:hypothetical protein [Rhodospirillales bacterium]